MALFTDACMRPQWLDTDDGGEIWNIAMKKQMWLLIIVPADEVGWERSVGGGLSAVR